MRLLVVAVLVAVGPRRRRPGRHPVRRRRQHPDRRPHRDLAELIAMLICVCPPSKRARRALTAAALAAGLAFGLSPAAAVDWDASPQVTRLALPFSGVWGVIQGFGEGTHTGYATWALDFVPAVPGGARRLPRGTPLARFPCFGAPVLAPADGTVVRAATGARDWPAHVKGRGDGNFVILQHAPHEF